MTYRRHPKYKDSGIPWIGEMPESWGTMRLKYGIEINPSKSQITSINKNTAVSFIPMEAISNDGSISLQIEKSISEVSNGYTFFCDGDVVFAKIIPCFENQKVAEMKKLKNRIGFGSTALIVTRPKNDLMIGRYTYWLFLSESFRRLGELNMYGATGQKRVSNEFVRNFISVVPPIKEQTAIADYLDRETAKIDALVSGKRCLIELLKEKRQGMISHAVTKGLDPNAPMKESGVEWIGEIPECWEVTRLKYISADKKFSIVDGPFGTQLKADEYRKSGIPLIRISNLTYLGKFNPENLVYIDNKKAEKLKRSSINREDIVIGKTGATIGKSALIRHIDYGIIASSCIKISVNKKLVNPRFLIFLIISKEFQEELLNTSEGSTRDTINIEPFSNLEATIPSITEQTTIANYLDRETAKIDALIAEATDSIKLLQERRSSLISEAVTSKIDVHHE